MADKKPSLAKKLLRDQRTLLAIVIVAIVVIVSFINPKFIGIGNIITIFQQISVLGILTMAMSMLLISGGIDLSIGNIMVLSAVVMYVALDNGMPTAVAVLGGLLTGAACGLLNGAIIAKSKCIPLVAAAIIGGVTFDGGKGTIGGAFLGCLLMGVISNAMNILGVDNNVQTIVTGVIIVAAVVLSNLNNLKKK